MSSGGTFGGTEASQKGTVPSCGAFTLPKACSRLPFVRRDVRSDFRDAPPVRKRISSGVIRDTRRGHGIAIVSVLALFCTLSVTSLQAVGRYFNRYLYSEGLDRNVFGMWPKACKR
jgi:hypothetical protein